MHCMVVSHTQYKSANTGYHLDNHLSCSSLFLILWHCSIRLHICYVAWQWSKFSQVSMSALALTFDLYIFSGTMVERGLFQEPCSRSLTGGRQLSMWRRYTHSDIHIKCCLWGNWYYGCMAVASWSSHRYRETLLTGVALKSCQHSSQTGKFNWAHITENLQLVRNFHIPGWQLEEKIQMVVLPGRPAQVSQS